MDRLKSKFILPEYALNSTDLRGGGGGRIAAAGTGVERELLNAVGRRGPGHNGRSCTKRQESCDKVKSSGYRNLTDSNGTRKSAKITAVFCNAVLSLPSS
jgi:hypothetical protein